MNADSGHEQLPQTYQGIQREDRAYNLKHSVPAGEAVDQDTGISTYITYSDEPLYDSGGLDHNEVAEIVGHEVRILGQFEDGSAEDGPEDYPLEPASVQVRGSLGINLDQQNIINGFQEESRGDGDTVQLTNPNLDGAASVYSSDEQGRLQTFGLDAMAPTFENDAAADSSGPYGLGGVVQKGTDVRLVYPTDMGIRGPVVDENDDLSVVAGLVMEQTEQIPFEAYVQVSLYYNVMEIEGVRQDFGMPPV